MNTLTPSANPRNYFVFVPICCFIISMIAGCGKNQPTVAYNPDNDPLVNPASLFEPAPEDRTLIATEETLFLNLDGAPQNLNPIFGSSQYEFMVSELMFDQPFNFDRSMEWITTPHWVESFEEAQDHLSAIVKLKPGLSWQDGVPITAHDIVYSWQSIVDDKVPCPAVKTGTSDVIDCIALDDLTVKYIHKEAVPTAKWNVLFPIIPKHLYEKQQDKNPDLMTGDYYSQLNRNPIGSGPYKLVEWAANERIVLERWEDYPGPKPYFKRIVFRLIQDRNAQLLAFEKGELDCILLSQDQFANQTNDDRFAKVGVKLLKPEWSYYYIGWNMDGKTNQFFNDKRVRLAMTHALNMPLILEKILYNLSDQAPGIYHPDAWMYNPEVQLFPFDLAKAEQLLEEAGWIKDEQDGWRYKTIDGKRSKFEFTLSIPQGSAIGPQVANYYQQDLRSIGVDMNTRTIEWATFQQMTRKHEFQSHIAGWGTGTDPDTGWNLWRTEEYDGGRNYGGYSNPRVDELFAQGRKEFDAEKRKAIYQEIHKLIYDDQPYTFIFNRASTYAINKRIRGVQSGPRGIFNFDPSIRGWWTPAAPDSESAP